MTRETETQQWDSRYLAGEYAGEKPVDFVGRILVELGEEGLSQLGLYVGCGNGRNFIPLLRRGLSIKGIDVSGVRLDQLLERCPEAAGSVDLKAFKDMTMAGVFDYIVSIQSFQHGNTWDIQRNFKQTRDVLKPGGRLFLRVNSTSTDIVTKHHAVENNKYGGFTIVYDEGPKEGAKRHFFSHQELEILAASNSFQIDGPMTEVNERRIPPQSGTWSQWESVWRKK